MKAFDEASTHTSTLFLVNLLKAFPFKVECVQTDNRLEFTKHFASNSNTPTLFERTLKQFGIQHKLIKPFTPRHIKKQTE